MTIIRFKTVEMEVVMDVEVVMKMKVEVVTGEGTAENASLFPYHVPKHWTSSSLSPLNKF